MQAQLHKKYDLRSSRKRSRTQDQNEEPSPSNPSKSAEKGKKPLDQVPSKKKESPDSILHKPKVYNIEQLPLPSKPVRDKEKEPVDVVIADRSSSAFNLQKELEKVKIFVPLIELLKPMLLKARAGLNRRGE